MLSPSLVTADVTPNDIGKYMIGDEHGASQAGGESYAHKT